MGSLFSRKPAPLIGLDISSSSAKLVELGRTGDGTLVLERCGIVPLEAGWINEGNIERFDDVVAAVRRLVSGSGSRAKHAALALPASMVITKKILLPAGLSAREMEMQVQAEANQYIPFSLDEVNLDFYVIGPSADSADDLEVMIAASRKEKVEDCQGLAEAAGLTATVVDVDSNASRLAAQRVIRLFPYGGGDDALVALCEIGSASSTMQVLRGDDVLYERDQNFGGAQLTQMIARQYGFTREEAELKKRAGELPNDYSEEVLLPFVNSLAQEIEKALKLFFTSTPNNRVDSILLAGGAAGLHGLPETITHYTSFPCRVVDPFEGMVIGPGVREQKLLHEAPSYLTACGLAMRRFLP
ncbi:MAG: pilus assembly protein PilM [Burkholderiaceae bacterium]|nr:pilus assembly protein PilM [Burkholderiaceae bacterium]